MRIPSEIKFGDGTLEDALQLHQMWANNLRDGKRLVVPDFYNMSKVMLSGRDLRNAILSEADLSGANLFMADLSHVTATVSNLTEADLDYANMYKADFRSANLSGATLVHSNLRFATLDFANLSRANLGSAIIVDASMTGANLSEANLGRSVLTRTDLDLAIFDKTSLAETSFSPTIRELHIRFLKECPVIVGKSRRGGRIVYRTATSRHVGDTRYIPGNTYVAPILSYDVATECHPGIYAASFSWMRRNYPYDRYARCYVRDGDWTITAKGAIRCKRIRVLSYV